MVACCAQAATRTARPDRISGRQGPRTKAGSTANGPDRISITSYSLQSSLGSYHDRDERRRSSIQPIRSFDCLRRLPCRLCGVSFVPAINVSIRQIRVVFLCSLAYFFLSYSLTEHGGVRLFQI